MNSNLNSNTKIDLIQPNCALKYFHLKLVEKLYNVMITHEIG